MAPILSVCESARAYSAGRIRKALTQIFEGHGAKRRSLDALEYGDASRWSRDHERDRGYVALDPALVLEVTFDQVAGGRMRHGARALRWRTDKSPRTCTADQLEIATSALVLFDM